MEKKTLHVVSSLSVSGTLRMGSTGNISGSRDLTEEEMAQLGITYGN